MCVYHLPVHGCIHPVVLLALFLAPEVEGLPESSLSSVISMWFQTLSWTNTELCPFMQQALSRTDCEWYVVGAKRSKSQFLSLRLSGLVWNLLLWMSLDGGDWFISHRWWNTHLSGAQCPYRPRLALSACVDGGCLQANRQPHANTVFVACSIMIHMSPLENARRRGKGWGERREGTREEERKEDLKAVEIKGASVLPPGVLSGEFKRKVIY